MKNLLKLTKKILHYNRKINLQRKQNIQKKNLKYMNGYKIKEKKDYLYQCKT